MHNRVGEILVISLCLLLVACSSRYDERHGGSWRGYSETGYASYYADRYHGKKTASGEIYRNNLNSAAHMELPFGSMVRVTNLANGKSVVVKGRCEQVPDMRSCLSSGAMKKGSS
ncbi:septal ring lytic transglycosylase RlpA family protein [Aeromonas veronii]